MRKKFIFYGQVQGIGFRFRASRSARKHKITGWVKNNDDGSVTLVTEGSEKNIENLINYLKNYLQGKIENIRVLIEEESIEKEEGLEGFKIYQNITKENL